MSAHARSSGVARVGLSLRVSMRQKALRSSRCAGARGCNVRRVANFPLVVALDSNERCDTNVSQVGARLGSSGAYAPVDF